MTHSFEEQIRERAYHLWQSGGMAEGSAHDHWLHAERALMSEQAFVKSRSVKASPTEPAKTLAAGKTAKVASAKTSSKPKTAKSPVATMVKKTSSLATRVSNTIN